MALIVGMRGFLIASGSCGVGLAVKEAFSLLTIME
jgi:hypothetical protein